MVFIIRQFQVMCQEQNRGLYDTSYSDSRTGQNYDASWKVLAVPQFSRDGVPAQPEQPQC